MLLAQVICKYKSEKVVQMKKELIKILKQQVKPAIGCTEPIAVALAVACAKKYIGGEMLGINILVSPSIFKNGFSVTIPGTTKTGNAYAAALSYICGDSDLGLEVLRDSTEEDYMEAEKILPLVNIKFDMHLEGVYVSADIETTEGVASAVISESHDNISLISVNGESVFEKEKKESIAEEATLDIKEMTLVQLREEIEKFSYEDLKFMLDGVNMNLKMAEEGLANKSGLGIGNSINELIEKKIMDNSLANKSRMMSAAATDARMGGVNLPVMSSAGSGNHGITAIIPIKIVAEEYDIDDRRLVKAIAFSHLVTYYVKNFTGRLSPVCGCAIAAGVGAVAGITWMLGGDDKMIDGAINNMIGNLSGMLCDGAKHDCALKISTSASEAVVSSLIAMNGVIMKERNGIVFPEVEMSIQNLGSVCANGMTKIDGEILKVMM